MTGRDERRGRAVAGRPFFFLGSRTTFVAADLSTLDGPSALADTAEERLGGVDVLVNNAGVYAFAASPDIGGDAFDAMFTLNVRGTYLLTTTLLPRMAERGPRGRGRHHHRGRLPGLSPGRRPTAPPRPPSTC